MTARIHISQVHTINLIIRRVGLELIRRKDFYVLLLFMALFVGGVMIFRLVGIDAPATGTLLLNLGLTLAWFASHLLVLLMAARLLPAEFEQRTIYPLLARPMTRGMLLTGFWMACSLSGVVCWFALSSLVWIGVPKLESYDTALLTQMMAMQLMSLGMLAALTIAGSLVMPKPVNLILMALLWLGGGRLAGMSGRGSGEVSGWLAGYIPDFSRLNLITRYTDGIGPLGGMEFLGLVAYGALFIAAALALAGWAFSRQRL